MTMMTSLQVAEQEAARNVARRGRLKVAQKLRVLLLVMQPPHLVVIIVENRHITRANLAQLDQLGILRQGDEQLLGQ